MTDNGMGTGKRQREGEIGDGERELTIAGPFLYPGFDHAYKKIEKSIKAMGARGTMVPEGGEEAKKSV